jgi:hypothetical protein
MPEVGAKPWTGHPCCSLAAPAGFYSRSVDSVASSRRLRIDRGARAEVSNSIPAASGPATSRCPVAGTRQPCRRRRPLESPLNETETEKKTGVLSPLPGIEYPPASRRSTTNWCSVGRRVGFLVHLSSASSAAGPSPSGRHSHPRLCLRPAPEPLAARS